MLRYQDAWEESGQEDRIVSAFRKWPHWLPVPRLPIPALTLHSPSEHRVDGTNFAAELHLVHADADGNLAVVGLLFKLGAHSPVVQAILDAAPNPGDTVGTSSILNAKDYLPAELGYYRYDGSKTTPPCDEPVEWYVMRHQKTVSQEQVDDLLALSGGPTNRPVQPIGDRVITAR